MNKRLASLVLFALLPSIAQDLSAQRPARGQRGARFARDGVHVVVGRKWYDPATWKEVRPVAETKPAKEDAMAAFAEAISAAGKKATKAALRPRIQRSTLPRAPVVRPGAQTTRDGAAGAAIIDGELWAWRKGGAARKLTDGLDGARHFYVAESGTACSYIKDNDLFVVTTADGRTHRLTKDGGENTFNGELDWVYQEEVYGRYHFKGTWWSPTGTHVAFLRIDETGVDTFSVVDHLPDQLDVEHLKYPKAGRTNPRATLHIAHAGTGKVVAVDLSKYAPEDEILTVRVGWTPKGDRCVFMIQNREQTWLDLDFANPDDGSVRTVIHEESRDSWVERLPMPNWLTDGTFLWESDRTGYRHFYRYDRKGELLATISKGEWSARSAEADRRSGGGIIKLDEEGGWIGFYGNAEDYAVGRHAYYATLDGKTLHRVTKGRGTHIASFSGDGQLVLDSFNHLESPGEQWLRKNDGTDVRKIATFRGPRGRLPVWKQIKARDGELLDVMYALPRKFDETSKYPVWIETYSGPAAPTVRDRFRGPVALPGIILLQVNVRSASTAGMKYTKRCYRQFGVQELRDIEDAIDWICKNAWADASRVGISGWSYGGFMTAFALTHSKKFKCGIAGAGVYDWALYDTIYTERYMQTPQHNPEGYRASSVVAAAKNLHGDLLIVHGTMDDNVHMQNAIQFLGALQRAGKTNFTFMLYPKSRHGVAREYSAHHFALRQKFMREHL